MSYILSFEVAAQKTCGYLPKKQTLNSFFVSLQVDIYKVMELLCQRKAVLTGHKSSIYAIERGLEKNVIYSADGNGWVAQWNLLKPDDGKLLAQVPSNVFSLRLLKERALLAVGSMTGALYFIDLKTGKLLGDGLQLDNAVYDMLVFGKLLLVGTGKGLLWLVNLNTLNATKTIQICKKAIRCIRKHPTQAAAILGCSDNNAYLFDLSTLKPTAKLEKHQNSVFSAAFVGGGKYLLTGSRDAHLSIWRVEENSYRLHHSIPAHLFTINDIATLLPHQLIATASRDKSIKIWSARNFELLKVIDNFKPELQAHLNSVNKLLWLPESNTLVSASDDRTLMLWQIEAEADPPTSSNNCK